MNDTNKSNKEKDDSNKLADEYLQRASYLGTILPLLDIVYEIIIEKQIKKYNLNIVKEFWIFLGLFVFTLLYYFYGIRLEAVLFFLLATILTLIIYNLDFFRKRVIPDVDAEIKNFMLKIEQKSVFQVGDFIKQYRRKIKESEIISIIDSKHGNHWLIYDYLLKYQKFSEKILIILIDKKKMDVIGENLFIKYIKKFKFGISLDTFKHLTEYFRGNPTILKKLNLYNPSYINEKKFFKTIASSIQLFYISARNGLISKIITFISIIFAILAISFNIQYFSEPFVNDLTTLNSILLIINFLFIIVIFTMFIIVILTLLCIGIAKFLWFILGYFSPEQPQI